MQDLPKPKGGYGLPTLHLERDFDNLSRKEMKPKDLEEMCLAQFATHYIYTTHIPKRSPPTFDKGVSLEKSNKSIYTNDQKMLPKYIDLSEAGLGKMKLRSYPSVMRIHDKKEGAEKYYSELAQRTSAEN